MAGITPGQFAAGQTLKNFARVKDWYLERNNTELAMATESATAIRPARSADLLASLRLIVSGGRIRMLGRQLATHRLTIGGEPSLFMQ